MEKNCVATLLEFLNYKMILEKNKKFRIFFNFFAKLRLFSDLPQRQELFGCIN